MSTTPPPAAKANLERKRLPWRSLSLFAIAVLATVLFVWIASELREGELDKIDTRIAIAVHHDQNVVLDVLAIAFTLLGSGPILLSAVAAVCFWAYRRGRRSYIVIVIANCFIAMVLNPLLKLVFERARPTLFEVISRPDTYSFPSGHSMSAVTVYGALAAVIIALRPTVKPIAVIVAMIFIVGIGLSRVYLGAHWPMDVIAGWASGVPFLVTTVYLLHRAKRGEAK
ncbi:MAG TPA: phosphatase PAP2 family protein [Kofleriaceae bacterium]|nr:phosphatase PAP2 family protein [Kofleriaceae bacterium]